MSRAGRSPCGSSALTWRGFGIDRWFGERSEREIAALTHALWAGIRSGRLPLPMQARATLPDFKTGLHLASGGGHGKVLHGPSHG